MATELGTTARTNELLGGNYFDVNTGKQIKQFKPLPQATPPESADQVNSLPNFKLPSISPTTPNTGNVGGLVAYYNKLYEVEEKRQTDYQAQIDAQRQKQEKETKPFLSFLKKAQSPSEVREDAMEETGIVAKEYFASQKARLAEVDTLNKEYNALIAVKDKAKAEASGRNASQSFINNQLAQIDRNAAPELNRMSANINSKAALIQAEQGLFREAQSFVDQAVQDATADLKFNYDLFNTFYDTNQNIIDKLDVKYQNSLKESKAAAETAWKTAVDEKTEVGKLLVDNPQANISINDTLDEAYAKISANPYNIDYQIKQAQLGKIRAEGRGGGNKFTPTQFNKGANNAGLTLDEFKALPSDVQNFFVSMTSPQRKEFNQLLADVKDGEIDIEDAKAQWESTSVTPSVLEFINETLDSVAPAPKGPGLIERGWNKVKNWLGI